jgi:hypothetical protein
MRIKVYTNEHGGRYLGKAPWYTWPESRDTGYVAWYLILWRLLCMPLVLLGGCLWSLGVLLTLGKLEWPQ